MAIRIEEEFQNFPSSEPQIYDRTEDDDDISPSNRGLVEFAVKCVANLFFVTGLLLCYELMVFGLQPVFISILMASVCCLFIYLRTSVCSHSYTIPEPEGSLRSHDPPRYHSTLDLKHQFKVTLPSYEEACGYCVPPPKYSCVVPIHLPKPVSVWKDEDLTK